MVLRLKESEECIEAIINAIPEANDFTVRTTPAEPEEFGKVGMCKMIYIHFTEANYQRPRNVYSNCANLINTVTFQIRIMWWDLICHQEAYDAAQAIMEEIRGKQILKFDTTKATRCSPAWIDKFYYKELTEDEVYTFVFDIVAEFAETYDVEACH